MPTASLWQDTRTFFPLFIHELDRRDAQTVCVVGASDGKFVVPLARFGYHVIAIERDHTAIHGGRVSLPGGRTGIMAGLRRRLHAEGVQHQVTVLEADLFNTSPRPVDAVWTSCSWHYSANHHRPVGEFISNLQAWCRPGGLLGTEYMMPVELRHRSIEHYLDDQQILGYFDGWPVLWETYTPQFVEDPHVGNLQPHLHRMGLLIAVHP